MKRFIQTTVAVSLLTAFSIGYAQSVVQPGDAIIASSSNSPGSEGVANAIDGKPTKYLNFDAKNNADTAGFVVTPSIGKTLVTGMSLQSANDAPDRDPKVVTLEGSNDAEASGWASGNWELIAQIDDIPTFEARFETKTFSFDNSKGYMHYRWTVVETQGPSGCCFQIAEISLLGGVYSGPADVTQPGDPVFASSSNSPGSEGVANAIDGQPTKYLNFDAKNNAATAGFAVSPALGFTYVTGMALQSANDAPDRDAKAVRLEGSNDDEITSYDSGNWQLVTLIENIPAWTGRFQTKEFFFDNDKAFKHYRWTVVETQGPSGCCFQVAEVELLGGVIPADVTVPGDAVLASSVNSPGSEGVANAIDGQPTKYLNFDAKNNAATAGFIVTPSVGSSVVTGVHMQSANDAPDRDPKVITLEGSNDAEVTDYDSGNWQLIAQVDDIPAWTARFQSQVFMFDNVWAFKHYRWTVVETQGPSGCCFQIAEVELLGGGAPKDVTVPGDVVFASSVNSPGSEGVANAIDGQPTKYLNFDAKNNAAVAGFTVTPGIGATTITGVRMQTANDAPDRDPKVVLIEGTNDAVSGWDDGANWSEIVQIEDIPAITTRFTDQEFYFNNDKAYTSYRWTVVETQGPSGCCFQIAEVELLAATESVDCDLARFTRQPLNADVLTGEPATFLVEINGPWPLQWHKNGEPIAGATGTSYTSDPVTAENAGDRYSVEIKGCEISSEVVANIFNPDDHPQSFGVNFVGGGANGTPTSTFDTDIAGVQLQAYWNNYTAASGSGEILIDSKGVESEDVTFEWASSGGWGAGTGDATPTQRLLNGLVHAQPNSESYVSFLDAPAGKHTLIIYTVGIPLQFQEQNYKLLRDEEADEIEIFTKQMNADQHNPIQRYFRGTSTDSNVRTLANYIRFDNVSPDDYGEIRVEWSTKTTGFDRGVAINAVQLILNNPPAGDPPSIASNPSPTVAQEGSATKLMVEAKGEGLTYQWLKGGAAIPDGGKINGATTNTLTINGMTEDEEGFYSVAIFNNAGSVISAQAKAKVIASDASMKDDLVIHYKFDEASGSALANSGSGADASVLDDYGEAFGDATGEAGLIGKALSLDYSYGFQEGYTAIKDESTISLWVNLSEEGLDGFSAPTLVRNAEADLKIYGIDLGEQFELGFMIDNDTGGLNLSMTITAGPNGVRVTDPEEFTPDEWVHVAATTDGGQVRLYKNGELVGVTDYLDTINAPDVNYLSIGAVLEEVDGEVYPSENNPNFFTGQLDDLAMWLNAWSADEIASIYAQGKNGKDATTATVNVPAFVEPETVAPAEPPTISISRNGDGSVTATFEGKLQLAPTVNGPWTDSNETSPATVSPDGDALFGRAVSE